MTNLSQEQQDPRQSIQKSAMIWAVVLGVIVALLAYWIMGSQSSLIRIGASVVGGLVVAGAMFKKSFASGSKSARCAKCDAAFSITKTDSVETLASTSPKEEREEQDDKSTKVTTWVEDVFNVTDTYTCAKCQDTTTKEYERTRRKDEEITVEPAKSAKPSKSGGKAAAKPESNGKSGETSQKK